MMMSKAEQLKLPLGAYDRAWERESIQMVEQISVVTEQAVLRASHDGGRGATSQNKQVHEKTPMPTPTVDCRCNVYEKGDEWCKWFESGDCRDA
ncbi:MAG: hypothetical protein ABIH46_06035 [Chloroflexota bacterium]